MASRWKLPNGLTSRALVKRLGERIEEDNVLGRSAQLSYYFLLALFPFLLFLTTLLGYFTRSGPHLRNNLLSFLRTMMPASASELIQTTIDEIGKSAGGGKLTVGILATLWAASSGVGAISESLNFANNVRETRPWWKTRLIAVALTIALSILIVVALVLLFFGGEIGERVAAKLGYGTAFSFASRLLQWPLGLGFALLAFSLIYYFAPNLNQRRWRWITPGTITAVFLWSLASFAFRLYLHFFNSYSATYGSLGAVIIMMLWFYFTGAAILIGGEIDCALEEAAAVADKSNLSSTGEIVTSNK